MKSVSKLIPTPSYKTHFTTGKNKAACPSPCLWADTPQTGDNKDGSTAGEGSHVQQKPPPDTELSWSKWEGPGSQELQFIYLRRRSKVWTMYSTLKINYAGKSQKIKTQNPRTTLYRPNECWEKKGDALLAQRTGYIWNELWGSPSMNSNSLDNSGKYGGKQLRGYRSSFWATARLWARGLTREKQKGIQREKESSQIRANLNDCPQKLPPPTKSRFNYIWLQRNKHPSAAENKPPAEHRRLHVKPTEANVWEDRGKRQNTTEASITAEATHILQGWASKEMAQRLLNY